MALLEILIYPDPRLRKKALAVETVDRKISTLVDDMAQTMYAAPGIGLAATQVNVQQRVVIIDLSEERNQLQVFINPLISDAEGSIETEEGCLSLPGIVAPITRHEHIRVCALDREGKPFETAVTGLLAICLQHEVDHLDGKVFTDHLSRLKRDRIRKRLVREAKEGPPAPTRENSLVI